MTPAHRPVDALCDAFVEDYAALDPISATGMGVPGYEDKLPDLSPEGYEARESLERRAHAAVGSAVPADERERSAKEAFLERSDLQLEQYATRLPRYRMSVTGSDLHGLRACFDQMDTSSEQGWCDIDSRLAAVPATLAGYRRTLLEEAALGNVSASRLIGEAAAQVASWTGQTGSSPGVFSMLVQDAPDGSLKPQLLRHADAATQAFAEFGAFLEHDLAPRGVPKEAVGRERYALESRMFLGATVDLDETYAWGWDELGRIEDEMARVAHLIVPGGSVDDAVAALDAEPSRSLPTKEAFRDWMQGLADQTLNDLADVHFDIPEPARRIECMIAPTTDGSVYYTQPNEDFTRPGRMWWSVPEETSSFSTWREVTTVYHEGVPGHHLQIAQTILRHDLLNRWQRQMCWVSGSGEGWALYAERLMDELGYLQDPGNRLGMLDMQAFRACRVIVDIGMHLELKVPSDNRYGFQPGEPWTPAMGYEFMRAHTRTSDAELRYEVSRYLGWPGQAPSYKVGERLWLQARENAKARAGSTWDLKAFHSAALNLGAIGLDPLTAALERL